MRWFTWGVCSLLLAAFRTQAASLPQDEVLAEMKDEVVGEQQDGVNSQRSNNNQGFQLPGGRGSFGGIGFPMQVFPAQGFGVGGSPFRFARGTYPAVMGGGGMPAPNLQAFPAAFNPGAGFAPLGLNRAMRGMGDPFMGVNFMPAGGPFFLPFGDGGYSLVPNSLLPNLFGGGQSGQGATSGGGTEGRANQGAAAVTNEGPRRVASDPFVMPFFNPTVFNPYGAPGAFSPGNFNPRGDGFSPFLPNTFTQPTQPGAPGGLQTGPGGLGQPGGGATDGFFPFSAADIPPPQGAMPVPAAGSPATVGVRELAGRGIPSVAAIAPDSLPDDGK